MRENHLRTSFFEYLRSTDSHVVVNYVENFRDRVHSDENIDVVNVFEDDWKNKRDVVKQNMLRHNGTVKKPKENLRLQKISFEALNNFAQSFSLLRTVQKSRENYGIFSGYTLLCVFSVKKIHDVGYVVNFVVKENYDVIPFLRVIAQNVDVGLMSVNSSDISSSITERCEILSRLQRHTYFHLVGETELYTKKQFLKKKNVSNKEFKTMLSDGRIWRTMDSGNAIVVIRRC